MQGLILRFHSRYTLGLYSYSYFHSLGGAATAKKIDFAAEIRPNLTGSALWPPKGTSMDRNSSSGVLTMSLSAIVPEKSRGNKKCDEEEKEHGAEYFNLTCERGV